MKRLHAVLGTARGFRSKVIWLLKPFRCRSSKKAIGSLAWRHGFG